MVFIGTAGWNIPARQADDFPSPGTHLARYAARIRAVEINSSFYRPHQKATYERWAASVPEDFRFSVKLPRSITQENRLKDYDALLAHFLAESAGLGAKLGVILVQLPPSLTYDAAIAGHFFAALRGRTKAAIACEPRHASWFTPEADAALKDWHVARVAADPPRAPRDGEPGGWHGLRYWRLHGSPRTYYSSYSKAALKRLAARLSQDDWCMFDNTTSGAALGNAWELARLTGDKPASPELEFRSPVMVASAKGKTMARKYSKAASRKVEKAMHERKKGTLKSGSGKKVKSKKQAIAIGLSEARKEGKKAPRKAKKTKTKKARKKPARKKAKR